jgi:hypothetical protein
MPQKKEKFVMSNFMTLFFSKSDSPVRLAYNRGREKIFASRDEFAP